MMHSDSRGGGSPNVHAGTVTFRGGWSRVVLAILLLGCTARADYTTTVDPGLKWGKWDGWGVSLCWWANVFGQRDDLADIIFSLKSTYLREAKTALPGLGLNIARYNAGACSTTQVGGASMVLSPNIPAFKQMQGYWIDNSSSDPTTSSWNWAADANQRAMLLKAQVRGANLFELFSNSPMWWMCRNHNPSGAANGEDDNLLPAFYRQHAVYLATIARHARDALGVTFTSVEPFNEPIANWWKASGTQEGCHFDATTQAKVIPLLRAELDVRGLTGIAVSASDESYYDQALATWNSFSPATRALVGRVNVHGYQYAAGQRRELFAAVAGKKFWNSEYGDNDGTGMSLADNLDRDLRTLHVTAWCYWQALDGGGWGLVQSNPGDNWIGPVNPKYYVLAQFTRHIRSGMTIIDGGEANTIAAYDAAARKLVIVTTNHAVAQSVTYDLSKFGDVGGPITRWITVTGPGDKYASYHDLILKGKSFTAFFPVNSIQTFEIENVDVIAGKPNATADTASGAK